MGKIKLILGASILLIVSGQVNASEIHAIATGEIRDFVDPNDILGYGGTGAADGRRVTFHFTFNTDSAPPDFYGGARAPREADYFTNGNSTTAPSWMASSIEFDNGASYHSDTYVGTDSTTDGVKVIERDGGSPYDYIHYYDAKIDSERAFNMGVFVYEYVENLVDGLAIDQLPVWTLTPNTFYEQPRGRFAFADYAAGWEFNGQVVIDSLTVVGDVQVSALQFIALETFENNLYRIDTDNLGSPEFLGVIGDGSGPDLSELVNAGPNLLYTLDRQANALWTISIDDLANPVVVGLDRDVTPHPRGLDMSPAGVLYGVFGMQLFSITPAMGTTTFIAEITGASGVEAIAFAPDGTLYAAGSPANPFYSDTLYTLNISTGQLTQVGTILVNGIPVSDIDTLAYAADGYLYGADSVSNVPANLIRIDSVTATGTITGNTAVTGLNGLSEYTAPAKAITIDIKPGSDPNSINPRSKGVIPLAVLGSTDFDATQVDPTTVTFGPDSASTAHNGHIEDVDDDGYMDAVFHFRTQETGIVCGDTEATLNGETFDETLLTGTDTVNTVGCKGASAEKVDETSAGAVSLMMFLVLGVLGLWRLNRRTIRSN